MRRNIVRKALAFVISTENQVVESKENQSPHAMEILERENGKVNICLTESHFVFLLKIRQANDCSCSFDERQSR